MDFLDFFGLFWIFLDLFWIFWIFLDIFGFFGFLDFFGFIKFTPKITPGSPSSCLRCVLSRTLGTQPTIVLAGLSHTADFRSFPILDFFGFYFGFFWIFLDIFGFFGFLDFFGFLKIVRKIVSPGPSPCRRCLGSRTRDA